LAASQALAHRGRCGDAWGCERHDRRRSIPQPIEAGTRIPAAGQLVFSRHQSPSPVGQGVLSISSGSRLDRAGKCFMSKASNSITRCHDHGGAEAN
jgi:hypothetical protein